MVYHQIVKINRVLPGFFMPALLVAFVSHDLESNGALSIR